MSTRFPLPAPWTPELFARLYPTGHEMRRLYVRQPHSPRRPPVDLAEGDGGTQEEPRP